MEPVVKIYGEIKKNHLFFYTIIAKISTARLIFLHRAGLTTILTGNLDLEDFLKIFLKNYILYQKLL